MFETVINLRPEAEWRAGMTTNKLIAELDQALRFPGVPNAWTMPNRWMGQLLRSFGHPALKQGRDSRQCRPRLREVSMQSGERNGGLPGMLGLAPDGCHEPGAAGDGLAPSFRMRQSNEQTPPVVDQSHGTSSQLTAMQVVRRIAAPTPLILEFIEGGLGIRPIPVELTEAENLVVGVGHENGVLVTGDLLPPFPVGLNERQHQLVSTVHIGDGFS
ncbi:MAG: hypothetical protein J0M13_16135 [Candidatus Accumulibacter sp.]|nr:hypothetical protein [Candidatus Accumulibacter necessarius]